MPVVQKVKLVHECATKVISSADEYTTTHHARKFKLKRVIIYNQ